MMLRDLFGQVSADDTIFRYNPVIPAINLIGLSVIDLQLLKNCSQQFNLDFDDAYQYVAAEKYDLTLVSFDKDFDRTPRCRKTPGEIITQ